MSARAEQNLIDIGSWIAQDDPLRAFTFVRELRMVCKALGDFPRAYSPFPTLGPNARRRTYANYVVVYDVESDRVMITAIVHGARDIDALDF